MLPIKKGPGTRSEVPWTPAAEMQGGLGDDLVTDVVRVEPGAAARAFGTRSGVIPLRKESATPGQPQPGAHPHAERWVSVPASVRQRPAGMSVRLCAEKCKWNSVVVILDLLVISISRQLGLGLGGRGRERSRSRGRG